MYKTILFDLDGTLLDTSEGIMKSIVYTYSVLGITPPSYEEQLSYIGPTVQSNLEKHLHLKGEDLIKASEIFRNRYKDFDLFLAKPYEGIFELLIQLKNKGYTIGVVTNKRIDYTLKLLDHFDFTKHFDFIYGTDFEMKLTKTDLVKKGMDYNKTKGEETIVVGDTLNDYVGAAANGCKFVRACYGFGFKKGTNKLNNDEIGEISSTLELLGLLGEKNEN